MDPNTDASVPENHRPAGSRDELSPSNVAASGGERKPAAELLPVLYSELRSLGRALIRRNPPGQTLQATALVHEAYGKLVADRDPGWDGRGHFFAAAAQAMREILVDRARRKAALKRGGDRRRQHVDPGILPIESSEESILDLDEALCKLEAYDPTKARIVMLKFFAGLTMDEIAGELGMSKSTLERQWRYTRAWLYRELDDTP
jgi:RNA polymerase sigma factor (TIGR02999 family)